MSSGQNASAMTAEPPAMPEPYFASGDDRFRLYRGDCLDLLPLMPEATFDLIFADPPYFLSNGGITCHAGKMVSVHKGKWDESKGAEADHEFTLRWLTACQRLLKPNGSIWVSGTAHIIHSVGYAMQQLGFKMLNDITWVKPNPPPNLSCRYFTHATETVIWAGRDKKCRHKFNYALMRHLNGGKQMTSVWTIEAPRREEKVFGKHPTQKSLALLERIIAASSDENDLVLDPFSGSGTTGIAAARLSRAYVGLETDVGFLDLTWRRFVGVPQADSPARILAMVFAHANGYAVPVELAERLGVSERQVHYYRQAAALLGLLARTGEVWGLTAEGAALCGQSESDTERRLARMILSFPLIAMIVKATRRCADDGNRRRMAALVLRRSTALAPSTCTRRAYTVLAWADWARQRTEELPQLLWDEVAPTTQEAEDAAIA